MWTMWLPGHTEGRFIETCKITTWVILIHLLIWEQIWRGKSNFVMQATPLCNTNCTRQNKSSFISNMTQTYDILTYTTHTELWPVHFLWCLCSWWSTFLTPESHQKQIVRNVTLGWCHEAVFSVAGVNKSCGCQHIVKSSSSYCRNYSLSMTFTEPPVITPHVNTAMIVLEISLETPTTDILLGFFWSGSGSSGLAEASWSWAVIGWPRSHPAPWFCCDVPQGRERAWLTRCGCWIILWIISPSSFSLPGGEPWDYGSWICGCQRDEMRMWDPLRQDPFLRMFWWCKLPPLTTSWW